MKVLRLKHLDPLLLNKLIDLLNENPHLLYFAREHFFDIIPINPDFQCLQMYNDPFQCAQEIKYVRKNLTKDIMIKILRKMRERVYVLVDDSDIIAVAFYDRPSNFLHPMWAKDDHSFHILFNYIRILARAYGHMDVDTQYDTSSSIDFSILDKLDFCPEKDHDLIMHYLKNREFLEKLYPRIVKSPPSPPSWGMELEIEMEEELTHEDKEFIKLSKMLDKNAGWDGSGPWEFTIGVYKLDDLEGPYYATKFLADYHEIWIQNEQGNHVHYRPAHDGDVEAWKRAYFSGHLAIVVFFPLIANHDQGCPMLRYRWRDWARFHTFEYWNDVLNFKDVYYIGGRSYRAITFNRHHKDTLTLECRAFESFPLQAYAFVNAWNYLQENVDYRKIVNEHHRLDRLYRKFAEGTLNYFETKIKPLAGLSGSLKKIALTISKELPEPAQEIIKFVYSCDYWESSRSYAISKLLHKLYVYI